MRFINWTAAPAEAPPVQRKNFINVQIDAIGVGLANAASPFLPVFLTRLGATNFQIGLLTAMPGVAGLFLALFVGRFLQTRRNIVSWFSLSRLLVISAFAATGLAPFIVPEDKLVMAILLIWAVATIPQTAVAVGFSVVMNAVAGPHHRYDLMARRWSILGATTAITVALAGQLLDAIDFPINYQVMFVSLSLGGLVSFIFSSRLEIAEQQPPEEPPNQSLRARLAGYRSLVFSEKPFVRFSIKRFVFLFGTTLAVPLFPLYYVRELDASDSWIGIISTAQTAVLLVGYSLWTRASRRRGSRFVLLATTCGLSLYPALVAISGQIQIIVILAAVAGIFQAGIDLVFFDEQMKTVPVEFSATFVSIAQMIFYVATVFAPLLGTWLATQAGISAALIFSSVIRFAGFALFAFWNPKQVGEL